MNFDARLRHPPQLLTLYQCHRTCQTTTDLSSAGRVVVVRHTPTCPSIELHDWPRPSALDELYPRRPTLLTGSLDPHVFTHRADGWPRDFALVPCLTGLERAWRRFRDVDYGAALDILRGRRP